MRRRAFLAALFAAPAIPTAPKLAIGEPIVPAVDIGLIVPPVPAVNYGSVVGGRLASKDGRMVFDLDRGIMTIRDA